MADFAHIGDTRRITGVFKNFSDVDTDPTTLRMKVRPPRAAAYTLVYGTDIEVVRDSAGNYRFDLALDRSGTWQWRWEATGAVAEAEEGIIRVGRSPAFYPAQ